MPNLDIFYRKYFPRQINKISRMVNWDMSTAEDIVQEAYLKAHRYMDTYDRKKGAFSTWFNRILFSTLRDYQKRHKLTFNIVDLDVDEFSFEDHINLDLDSSSKPFNEELDEFKNKQHRKIVVLHYVIGYSCSEIAHMENTSVNNVTTICSRFRARVKDRV